MSTGERINARRYTISDEKLQAFVEWIASEDAIIDSELEILGVDSYDRLAPITENQREEYIGRVAFEAGRKQHSLDVAEALDQFAEPID